MEVSLLSSLLNAGVGGLILVALVYFWKLKSVDQEALLARVDKIVDRHLASEEANRNQVRDLSEQNRSLFDRVITVCTSLGIAIQELSASTKAQERAILELSTNTKANERALLELSASTKANEKAINELRTEFRQIGGPQPPKALGHDDPRPFGPG